MDENLDRFREKVIRDLLGAATWRDVASEMVGALARSFVISARTEILGQSHASALEAEPWDLYPDLPPIEPGQHVPTYEEIFVV